MSKKIEQKYRSLSDIDHILLRPGMWVGSVKPEERDMFVFDGSEMISKTVTVIPAMMKIIDEVISNSVDEYRRSDNMGLNHISVSIDGNRVSVSDDGGIPVVQHRDAGCWLPEFIFGRLRTSSNYNDDDDRAGVGTNGVGVKIANIFSTRFEIETSDGKKCFHRSWSDHMKVLNDDLSVVKSDYHGTTTTFDLDFSLFEGCTGFDPDFVSVVERRCIDAAASNPGLMVSFTTGGHTKNWRFESFRQYVSLFNGLIPNPDSGITLTNSIAEVLVFPDAGIDVAFVNGAECSKGTHIRAVRGAINDAVVEFLKKKDKIEVTTRGVDGKYAVFMNISVSNPTYDSQTKDTLTTPPDRFTKDGKGWEIPDTFITKVIKSEIPDLVRDWFAQKSVAEDQKTLRRLNAEAKKGLKRPDKYVAANSKIKSSRELWIYEGDSAATGFRVARDPQKQGAYLMRGVPLNALGMTPVQIMKNEVFNDIISILGLKWGSEFNINDLNYGKIVIATDADVDGDKIAALLLLFFGMNWPELIEKHIVCRSISPIIIATKGKDTIPYYKLDEFRSAQKSLKGYQIKYTKGLGGLNSSQYKDMMRNPKFAYFKLDRLAETMFRKWFGSDSDTRKSLMQETLNR